MRDWNVIATVRHDYNDAIALLRRFGAVGETGLYNVLVMRVPDVRELLDQITQLPTEQFFSTVSHIVPVTHKLRFATSEEFERTVSELVLAWAPRLAGSRFHVRIRHRGQPVLHSHGFEQRLGGELLDELERRGTPGRIAMEDPDAVIAIETIRDEAGLAMWTRAELDRYPFVRASIDRVPRRRPRLAAATDAPSRALLAASSGIASQGRGDRIATAADLTKLLGELDPAAIERLLATGATVDEVAEAVSALEDEDSYGELHLEPSSEREAEVRAILEQRVLETLEEREEETGIART
jgi:tRNA(Ser,Leu) C12 N-acetylase TAN1